MACGSVYAAETQLGRDLSALELTRPDLATERSRQTRENPSISRSTSYMSSGSVHEAIRFLQAEHETVLSGLHQQIQLLQQRCDDLQFEAHLRHVTQAGEDALRKQVSELKRVLDERTARVSQLEGQLAQQQAQVADEQEQHRWREVQLKQQVEAGEQRVAELRGEVAKLRAQVRDLRVYSSALRTVGGRGPSAARAASRSVTSARPLSRGSRASVGSLDSLESSGPRSLGSEDGEAGSWRGARLGGAAHASARHARPDKAPLSPGARNTFSLPPTLPTTPPALPPLASLPPQRPSSSNIVLPPISAGQGVARPHVRRQLRLASAPILDIERNEQPPQRDPA
ncbi:stress response protein nst1-like isoform X2 [Penaeus japonicus]|nr:stress response protein nst1-like isoform X2 [Penaeus japonicus]XP_042871500.1 stress response protein nst1-like isoform X2 [Penaeus japonicus]XP_042871501.1 stress response protein nst1-like isoform X2 [Penaeus japonicus]